MDAKPSSRAYLDEVVIQGYRSIGNDPIHVRIPRAYPLVLTGENNAGKSNIVRAIGLILGESHPGSSTPDDHDYFGRNPNGASIKIYARVKNLRCTKCSGWIERFTWEYPGPEDDSAYYRFECDTHTKPEFVSKKLRAQLSCIVVGPERNIANQMSYSSKWTALSKLMHRFHSRLIESEDRVNRLKGFQKQLVSVFNEVPEFDSFSAELKSSSRRLSSNMAYALDFDFSFYDASNFYKSLRIYPFVDGEARSFDELGTGQAQLLTIAFSYAYAKSFGGDGLVLILEEPEAHLHPLSQQWVASKLTELCSEGAQVVVTTHSPYFVNLSGSDGVAIVKRPDEALGTRTCQLSSQELVDRLVEYGADPKVTKPDTIGQYFEDSATVQLKTGLFARCCVLVEGPTESGAFPELMSRIGWPSQRVGIDFISVGGIDQMARWVAYFQAHEVAVYPIFDSDSDNAGRQQENAKSRSEILRAIGVDFEPEWDDFDSYSLHVFESFAVFDGNFELSMREMFGEEYKQLDAEAGSKVGKPKPLKARYVSRRLQYEDSFRKDANPQWRAIKQLAERLYELAKADEPLPF